VVSVTCWWKQKIRLTTLTEPAQTDVTFPLNTENALVAHAESGIVGVSAKKYYFNFLIKPGAIVPGGALAH